jgi:hypothetical protein
VYMKVMTNGDMDISLVGCLLSDGKRQSCPCAWLSTGPWRRMGSGCIHSHFLDFGTCWMWVVSFTLLPHYPHEKSPRYPLARRLRLDDVEKRKFLTLPGLELRNIGRPACSQSLYRLRYPGSYLAMDKWYIKRIIKRNVSLCYSYNSL